MGLIKGAVTNISPSGDITVDETTEGYIVLKSGGKFINSAMVEEADRIFSSKTIATESGSSELGPAITLSERGGYLETHVNTTDRDFISVDYLVNDSGTEKPTYDARAPLVMREIIQPDDSVVMYNVTSYSINSPIDKDVIAVYLKLDNTITSARGLIRSQVTGLPIKYFPTESDYINGTGLNLSPGEHRLELITPIAELPIMPITIEIIADGQVDLLGDGVDPWRAIDSMVITYHEMALEEDIITVTERAKLSGIEDGAEANQTDAEIKVQYENNADTNAFTDAEKSKLAACDNGSYLGVFATLTALQTAHPTAIVGDTATVTDPSSNLFYWDGDSWEDSGTGYLGDMLKSVYDPTAKNADAFSMGNMSDTATKKVFLADERTKLLGIEPLAESNNISDTDATDLTDGGDSTLHYHDSDRSRINHTGTQLASTISDFDIEVDNNPTVVLNTAKRSYPIADETKLLGIEAGAKAGDLLSTNNLSEITDPSTARTNLGVDVAGTDNSTDVTLAIDDTTTETLGLAGQELTVNLVTTTTDGAMFSEDKLKLDNLINNGSGDSWVSGLQITEHNPKNQTIDYSLGTYLIDGLLKTITPGGNYALIPHYIGFTSYQHALVGIYVDGDETIKSIAGITAEKNEIADLPVIPTGSVCLAIVEIKVDNGANPKNIENKHIEDCRLLGHYGSDEFVKISADDETTGHLMDKITNNGNVTFTIENPSASETIKADVDVANDTAVLANTAKNSYPSADETKLLGIEPLAEVNQDNSEIKTQYEANSNTNAFTDADKTKLDGLSGGSPEYGELYMTARGNQSAGTTPTKVVWNTAGVSDGITVSTSNNRITILSDGTHKIEFSGSVLLKRNETYSCYIYVNGSQVADLGEAYTTVDNLIHPFGFSRLLSLSAGDYVEIYAGCTATKDFDLSPGAAFNVVKI